MKPAKIRPVKGGGFSVRLRCGAGQHESFRVVLGDRGAAQARADRMKALAANLVRAGRAEQAPAFLRKAGEQATDAGMREVEAYAAELCAKAQPTAAKALAPAPKDTEAMRERLAFTLRALTDPERAGKTTNVYVVAEGVSGKFKCGTAANVHRRMYSLQTGNPEQLVLVTQVEAPSSVEWGVHSYLNDFRLCGEWFEARALPLALGFLERVGGEWRKINRAEVAS